MCIMTLSIKRRVLIICAFNKEYMSSGAKLRKFFNYTIFFVEKSTILAYKPQFYASE